MQFHMWPSVLFMDIRLKMRTGKKLPSNGSLRENVSIFFIAPSCYNKQKCRYERTFKERNCFAKIPGFQIWDKSGGQFELLNWLEKSTRLLMLEDYDIVHFTIH